MRIAIMGSGGIGGYVGARLAEAGEAVSFIARGAHLQAMRARGLRVTSSFGDIDLSRIAATDTPAEIGPVDVVIFTVKTYDSEKAAKAILPLVGSNTHIVSLQNGIDSLETIARFVPREQIVAGATYLSGYIESPGHIVHMGATTDIVMGGAGEIAVEGLRAACERVRGIIVRPVQDIDAVLWEKFVILSAFSGGTSLMRSGVGAILSDSEAYKFISQLGDEGMAVAAAAGHPLDGAFKERVIARWQILPSETRSSMANDLAQGKPLELEWLSGRMHRLGIELGVPTPGHTAVYRALHLYRNGLKTD
jgi:2-dehydropantoate 2-reductase